MAIFFSCPVFDNTCMQLKRVTLPFYNTADATFSLPSMNITTLEEDGMVQVCVNVTSGRLGYNYIHLRTVDTGSGEYKGVYGYVT